MIDCVCVTYRFIFNSRTVSSIRTIVSVNNAASFAPFTVPTSVPDASPVCSKYNIFLGAPTTYSPVKYTGAVKV